MEHHSAAMMLKIMDALRSEEFPRGAWERYKGEKP